MYWVGNGNLLSILAWEIPWTEELGRLQSMGLQELDTACQLNQDITIYIFYETHHIAYLE